VYILENFKIQLKKFSHKFKFVLLIDELDTLATHDRKDFDMVVDFLNISEPGFVKIGISNTMDLFSTYKGTKNYLNSAKLTFKPYTTEDLVGILKTRI
jgi:Cdc6-like AAA superfamily ATPase